MTLHRFEAWKLPALLTTIALMLATGATGGFSPAVAEGDLSSDNATMAASPFIDSSWAAYRAGVQAYRQGDYPRALAYLKQAETGDPDNANLRYYLAVVLDKLSRPDEAVLHYQYVTRHGQDEPVVDYSRKRLALLTTGALKTDRTQTSDLLHEGIAVPLKPHDNALMVEAVLNGRVSGTFIVDTGATYTSISRDLYRQLGPENVRPIGTVRITTANGRIEVPKVLIERVSINGLEARNVEATVIDVRPGSSFSGLLGLSFIRQFKLTIDPKEGHLVFQAL